VHSASGGRLERVATQLLERPREALSTAQQTLSTCQQNLQTLQLSLQQSFVEGKSTLEQQVLALGEPGSPSTSGNRLSALLGPSRLGRGRAAAPAAEASSSQAASPVSPDSPRVCGHTGFTTGPVLEEFVPPPSGAGGARAAGAARTDDESGADEAAGARPWGPFQLQAHLRRRNKQRPASSSLREEGRRVTIVTTAALPWMTGTAVNPLLRAAYLARDGARAVTLMIPWLAQSDQERVFPNALTFDSPDQQEAYVRAWVRRRTGFDADFKVTFYPGRYAPEKCSILPVGDPTAYVPDAEADVAILEEPEHLNWYHHGRRWTDKFSHVVGVVHTNYLDYARREDGGAAKEALLRHINAWVTRIHCHKVVKLSDAVQELPKQTTEFVHGVADSFLSVGERKAAPAPAGGRRFTRGAYFLGKCVWGKGYTELLDLLTTQQAAAEAAAAPPAEAAAAAAPAPAPRAAAAVAVDCFGTGEDLEAVRAEAASRRLGLRFHGAKDHLDADMAEYQVFINPSTSDVVATTSAEALAMGKWVVCAEHPSNAFFSQFSNCLVYRTPEEFCAHVAHALAHEPAPLPPAERAKLTWEAATERFLDITELTENELRPGGVAAAVDSAAWAAHNTLTGMDALRSAVGAGRGTRDNPARLEDYQPSLTDMGGLFDDKKRAAAYRSMRQGPPALPAPKA
jgi:digalactosyldiacylglycerol synthase